MVEWVTAEIRSVKDKPFYCQSSVGTIPFQGRVFLLLAFCKQNASLQQLLSHMATVRLSTNCPKANSISIMLCLGKVLSTYGVHNQFRKQKFR